MMSRLAMAIFAGLISLVLVTSSSLAADAEADSQVQGVMSLLQQRCVECHSGDEAEGGLSLDTLDGLSLGNKRGAVVVPHEPSRSLLWEVVEEDRMPPDAPLSTEERRLLKDWILSGATGLIVQKNQHWAFQSVVRPELPEVSEIKVRTPIDQFLGRQLVEHQLTFRPEADRHILIRRVSFDLTGLPPTLNEIDEFIADSSATAYESMVDRYLASPRYGERWGKYWLDVSGYTESNGYFNRDSERPWAYRYRDYVIRSFKQDKPYDQFVCEQIAGDELAGYRTEIGVTPEMVDSLVATQYLRNAQDGTNESDGNAEELLIDKYSVLEGNLQIVMNGLLGLTIQCARCHSHKFEPISNEEYYQLGAIFYAAYLPEKWVKGNNRVVAEATREEQERHALLTEIIDKQISPVKASLEQMKVALSDQLIAERLQAIPLQELTEVFQANRLEEKERTEEQKSLLKTHAGALVVSDDDLAKQFPEFVATRDQIQQYIEARNKERPADFPKISLLRDVTPSPPPFHVLNRGQRNSPGAEVVPGVPEVLTVPENEYQIEPVASPESSGRRLAFARWITSRHNPLFARVMVNRIWQHHFGTGLVSTPDNFGQSGSLPSHPDLLSFLADEFVAQGWSIKKLHRLILHSAAYRQGGEYDEAAAVIDPQDQLLWRYPLRRLDAEAVRDSMLFVSGELELCEGGQYVPTKRNGEGTVVVEESTPGSHRRSIYLQQRRTQTLTFLELFDAPTMVTMCGLRTKSTVPLQSLTLLNSEFVCERSLSLAKRVLNDTGGDSDQAIDLAFRLTWGRMPTEEDFSAAKLFLIQQRQSYGDTSEASESAMRDFCQMLLASNAFLYID